jgi:hypothetical protein
MPGGRDVFRDRFRRSEVNALRFHAAAFEMKAHGRFVAVLMEVRNLQPAAGGDASAGNKYRTSKSRDRAGR